MIGIHGDYPASSEELLCNPGKLPSQMKIDNINIYTTGQDFTKHAMSANFYNRATEAKEEHPSLFQFLRLVLEENQTQITEAILIPVMVEELIVKGLLCKCYIKSGIFLCIVIVIDWEVEY